ncbi:MAG TPA: helix-turn-helix domain-containing protein [Rhodospirillaceae bacterium]|nr:helix-turn-helix domain-containing protein [Rhodospirillaceae bacterium]
MTAAKGLGIGDLAKVSGVKVETVRYYERIGLLAPPERTDAGYRRYQKEAIRHLSFIRRGRGLGFTIDEIRVLLKLAEHPDQACADANRLAVEHLVGVQQKIEDLTRLRDELLRISQCEGHVVAECRIIGALTDKIVAP